MKKSLSPGKIVALVIGAFLFLISLCAAFFINVYFLSYYLTDYTQESPLYAENEEIYEAEDVWEEEMFPEFETEDFEEEEEYYEFGNALRDDLAYRILFKEFYRDDFSQEEGEGKAVVEFSYPVVEGTVDNLEAINKTIQSEIEEVEAFVGSMMPHLSTEDVYSYTAESYVTYMSEDILSVIYVEYGYLNDEFVESYVKCYNIDMQTGMILKNTKLLEIDDAFSIDFRERCERQNGEINALSYYMDQDITDLMTDESSLIIFYTPLGMEVGFNYYEGWVTVTYQDYEQYEKKF